jgi:hypothetical protein
VKLIYPGPGDAVELSTLGIRAERGEAIEIEDAAIAKQLLAQGWTKAGRSAKEDADA